MGVNSVRIEIDELVFEGLRVDADRVSAVFEAELTRLIRERGVPSLELSLDALDGLPALPATSSPSRLGEALARAVHDGLWGRS